MGTSDPEGVRHVSPVEFFNLVLELKLTEQEKRDLVAFMRVL
jgi:hypothetical protein